MRRKKCSKEAVKIMALACVVPHNMCHELNDQAQKSVNVQFEKETFVLRPRELVREFLLMRRCELVRMKLQQRSGKC